MDRSTILQKLKDKTELTEEEMQYLDQNPMTDLEAFIIVEDDPKKVAEYEHYYNLRKAVNEGTLNEAQLRELVDTLFSGGQNQDEFVNADNLYESYRAKLFGEKKDK